ncbi:MAG: urease accessory protein UreD [Porticoccaceae bacterium]
MDSLVDLPATALARTPVAGSEGWRARLELGFARRGDRTALVRNRNLGPLRVQRPFYPAPDECQVYVLHPPGGLVAGDRLELDIDCAPGARVLLTTPGAGRVYRGGHAQHPQTFAVHIRVAAGAHCEWLPQENILFDGAWAENSVRVDLDPGAHYTGWDITCLGRPAAGETFTRGLLDQRLWLWREGRPLLGERLRIGGGDAQLDAPWGLAGRPVFGSLVTTLHHPDAIGRVRDALATAACADLLAAATELPELLIVRARAKCATRLRGLFVTLWRELRGLHDGCAPATPRIWAT